MIARYSDFLPMMRVDLPHCADVLIVQSLQLAGRQFCRDTEAWRERMEFNVVDGSAAYTTAYNAAIVNGMSVATATIAAEKAKVAARSYVIKPSYEAEVVRLWKVWVDGDETRPITDPRSYQFTTHTATLKFNSDLQTYSPSATAWATSTPYTAGSTVIQDSLRYQCAIAHTSDVFATDLAAYRWALLDNDIILYAVLLPRLTCNELAAWFMDKWGEGIVAEAKAKLMAMKNKNWSSADRVEFFHSEYNRYVARAIRERFTEDKSTDCRFDTPAFVR